MSNRMSPDSIQGESLGQQLRQTTLDQDTPGSIPDAVCKCRKYKCQNPFWRKTNVETPKILKVEMSKLLLTKPYLT